MVHVAHRLASPRVSSVDDCSGSPAIGTANRGGWPAGEAATEDRAREYTGVAGCRSMFRNYAAAPAQGGDGVGSERRTVGTSARKRRAPFLRLCP